MFLIKFNAILKTQFRRAILRYRGAMPTLFFKWINMLKTPKITF
jgi:hypothetical protein